MLKIPGRIPIEINPLFWVLAAMLGWINSASLVGTLIWVVTVLVSVLAHEYGHALTAVYFGQKAKIELAALGGVTFRQGGALKTWQEVFVILAGPLMGILLVLMSYLVESQINSERLPYLSYWLSVMFVANIFWTALNLLPVHPLDGGCFLLVVLKACLGVRGIKVALFISMLVALLMTALCFVYHFLIGGILFFMWTVESYRSWKNSAHLDVSDEDAHLQGLLKEANRDIKHGDLHIAEEKLMRVKNAANGGALEILSSEYLALLWSQEKRYLEAYHLLLPLRKKISDQSLVLLHQLAYRLKEWKESIHLGTQLYQIHPSYSLALTNAFCYANLENNTAAVGWLECAIKEGLPHVRTVLDSHEFDRIRSSAEFQKVSRRFVA